MRVTLLLLLGLGAMAQVAPQTTDKVAGPTQIPSQASLLLLREWPLGNAASIPEFSADSVVVFDLQVSAAGVVDELRRLSGPEALAKAGEDYLRKVQFGNPMVNGKPIPYRTTLGACFSRQFEGSIVPCTVAPAGDSFSVVSVCLRHPEMEKRTIHRMSPPAYPAAARVNRVTGTPAFRVLVGADGKVIDAKAASGPPLLYPAAQESIRTASFRPVVFAGQPSQIFYHEFVGFTY
jgi:hypothetical protein